MAKTTSLPKTRTRTSAKIDDQAFADVKEQAEQMRSDDSAYVTTCEDIDEMYLMTWAGGSGKKWKGAELKISPDARNQALGAVRLMAATDPIFNITNTSERQEVTDKVEKAIVKIFDTAGRVAGNPIHYDALLSAILYGEMHAAVTSTASLLAAAKENGDGVARAEALVTKTPFLINIWNPHDGHYQTDALGLSAYYRETDTTVSRLRADYGGMLPETTKARKPGESIKLSTFYDLDTTTVWCDDGVIMMQPHGLPFIPVVVQTVAGSSLWKRKEEAIQPFLYTLKKSGMWEMQNLIYSVMYTVIRDMGVTPLYVHGTPKSMQGKPLDLDFDESPGVINIEAAEGETFSPIVNKGLIDPAVQQGLQIATQKSQESTIYPQALGAPIEGQSTYSELALLSQSGRLPLVEIQRRGGWGLAAIAEMCLEMIRVDNTKVDLSGIDLKASEIPVGIQIECKLDVKLPQDKLQQANIASILTTGDDPITSKEWVRSNILNINQSGDMDRQIWTERASTAMFQTFLQQQIAAQMQAMQQQQTPAGVQGNPPGMGQSQPGQPTGQQQPMTAEPQMAPGQGSLVQGGLPPQQAGMMPGTGAPVEGI